MFPWVSFLDCETLWPKESSSYSFLVPSIFRISQLWKCRLLLVVVLVEVLLAEAASTSAFAAAATPATTTTGVPPT